MSLKVYENLEQRSDQWYEARRGIVTASTVGQLITPSTLKPASNDKSRALVYQLVAERITGHVEPTFTTEAMWRGIEDEPLARDLYAEKYAPVTEVGFMVRDDWGFRIGFSPDGLVGDLGLIEVKSREPKGHLRTILDDRVPPFHMAQCQAGLLVSGRQWLDYISYSGGMPMWVHRVWPDERWQDAILEAVRTFEAVADKYIEQYTGLTAGLPPTERIDHSRVELKL